MIAEKCSDELIVQDERSMLKACIYANERHILSLENTIDNLKRETTVLNSSYDKLNNEINNKNNISIEATISVGIWVKLLWLIFIVLSVINIVELIK